VVTRAAGMHPGDAVEILLHEGTLGARVEQVKERDERHQI
jgi:hypothetical protein